MCFGLLLLLHSLSGVAMEPPTEEMLKQRDMKLRKLYAKGQYPQVMEDWSKVQDTVFAGYAPLPMGWIRVPSKKLHNEGVMVAPYFVRTIDAHTTWSWAEVNEEEDGDTDGGGGSQAPPCHHSEMVRRAPIEGANGDEGPLLAESSFPWPRISPAHGCHSFKAAGVSLRIMEEPKAGLYCMGPCLLV